MHIPSPLSHNDTIAIVSPAGIINEKHVFSAVDYLQSAGYRVKLGKYVFARHHQFAGTDAQRAEDLQAAFNDPEVNTIICSRGGYGTLRTLQQIDWAGFQKYPKWIVGFSDITVLHLALNQLGYASVHGVMPRFFFENGQPTEGLDTLLKTLSGTQNEYAIHPHELNRTGKTTAPLIGGNLSILYSLRGTPYDMDTNGKILFIEDLSEYLYHLDRMMMNLKTGGKLKNLKGLIVGAFSSMKDNDDPFGLSVHEIIYRAVDEYDYPVCFNFPAGHVPRNVALKLNTTCQLNVKGDGVKIVS